MLCVCVCIWLVLIGAVPVWWLLFIFYSYRPSNFHGDLGCTVGHWNSSALHYDLSAICHWVRCLWGIVSCVWHKNPNNKTLNKYNKSKESHSVLAANAYVFFCNLSWLYQCYWIVPGITRSLLPIYNIMWNSLRVHPRAVGPLLF